MSNRETGRRRRAALAADLACLRETCRINQWSACPDDRQLQRVGEALMRVMFQADFRAAWRECGLAQHPHREPLIEAREVMAAGGLAHHIVLAEGQTEVGEGPLLDRPPVMSSVERSLKQTEFRDSVCAFHSGRTITRGELALYFARFASGTHADLSDEMEMEHADLIQRVRALEGKITVGETEGLRNELLAVGRRLTQSADMIKLERAILAQQPKVDHLASSESLPMIPASSIRILNGGVCAIGHLRDPTAEASGNPDSPNLVVRGTGFLIRPGIVLTTRHLVRQLRSEIDAGSLSADSCRVLFVNDFSGVAIPLLCKLERHDWIVEHVADIGLLEFAAPDPGTLPLSSLQFADSYSYSVGARLAVVGFGFKRFAFSLDADLERPYMYRLGPLFQNGVISAVAPHETARKVERLLIDARISEPILGAPIVDVVTGLGVGMVYARDGLLVAFGLPIVRAVIDELLRLYDVKLSAARSGSEVTVSA